MYYKLFAHNIPVKGKVQSVIYNLQKSKLHFIPNSFLFVLESLKTQTVQEIKSKFPNKDERCIIDEYFEFLEKNDLGFYTEEIEEYPDLDLIWDSPNTIINAIVEYNFNQKAYDLLSLVNGLDNLMCFHIEFRLKNVSLEDLIALRICLHDKVFRSVNLFIEYNSKLKNKDLSEFYSMSQKIDNIIVYNVLSETTIQNENPKIQYVVGDIFSDENYRFPTDHYIISVKYFTEAQKFHPFYNRKVCIDYEGNIKNNIRFYKDFGNVSSSDLKAVIQSHEFQVLWHACPDKVIDYKDDELRYCKFYTDNLEVLPNGLFKVAK
ncbi:hypothetical protein CMT75_17725 [Elizabethkingia anophelis]|nr:hypothetical protein [Elizabethkingia anophelis]